MGGTLPCQPFCLLPNALYTEQRTLKPLKENTEQWGGRLQHNGVSNRTEGKMHKKPALFVLLNGINTLVEKNNTRPQSNDKKCKPRGTQCGPLCTKPSHTDRYLSNSSWMNPVLFYSWPHELILQSIWFNPMAENVMVLAIGHRWESWLCVHNNACEALYRGDLHDASTCLQHLPNPIS